MGTQGYQPDRYACNDGHILYSENVYIDKSGWTYCKACTQIDNEKNAERRRETDRRYKERKRQAKAS